MRADASIEAPPLDRISALMEPEERRLDFAISLVLEAGIDLAALERGAASARAAFPKSTARLAGERWEAVPPPSIERHGGDPRDPIAAIEAWVEPRIDLLRGPPLAQLWTEGDGGARLTTRCHHAAGDLLSVLLFLDHQLAIATGREPAPIDPGLELKSHPSPRRKNRHAHAGPSRRLWRRRPEPSPARRQRIVEIEADPLRAPLQGRRHGLSYNDLLAAAVLDAAGGFQRARGAKDDRLALWFPVDVRKVPFAGFGNGSSRVRLYDRPGAALLDRARALRIQLDDARADGEWFVPERHPLFALPMPLIRAYLRRPWVDMGSLLYSHVERVTRDPAAPILPAVRRVEGLAMLDPLHPIGAGAFTLRGVTTFSFTWDPAQLDPEDVELFVELFHRALAGAAAELARCAA